MVVRVISGFQTGADLGGIDAAIAVGAPYGGWVPKGRKNEAGVIPAHYVCEETDSASYKVRTKMNVDGSDGTALFTLKEPTGGSKETAEFARAASKPLLECQLGTGIVTTSKGIDPLTQWSVAVRLHDPAEFDHAVAQLIASWVQENAISTLNVAGSRESRAVGIQERVMGVIVLTLCLLKEE